MDSEGCSVEFERKKESSSALHEAYLKSKEAPISNMKVTYAQVGEYYANLRMETLKREKETLPAKFFNKFLTGHENKRRLKESLAEMAAAHVAARSPRKVKKIAQQTGSGSQASN